MAGWRLIISLAALLAASCSATTSYGGYGHHDSRPHGDHDPRTGPGMSLVANFETGGVRGQICFHQAQPGANVTITVKLKGLKDQYQPQTFDWNIHTFPIRYSEYLNFPCGDGLVGNVFGTPEFCPEILMDVTRECEGALGQRLLSLDATDEEQVFTDNTLDLFGHLSPVGRSIVLRNTVRGSVPFTCANIEYQGITVDTLRAGFEDELQGDVIFRRQSGRPGTTFRVQLFQACDGTLPALPEELNWYLRRGTCDDPGEVLGNDTHADEVHHGAFEGCTRWNHRECPAGDLTTKCGPLMLELPQNRYRAMCTDNQLGLVPLSSLQETVLVFETPDGQIIDCQPWQPIDQLCARVSCVKRPRLNIDILFYQRDPTDRTYVRSYITGLDEEKAYLQVRRDPVPDTINCDAGGLYDKPRRALTPGAHVGTDPTGDVLPIGTLTHKITSPRGRQSIVKTDTTSWLSLFGPFSIIGRSIALLDEDGDAVACCNINPVTDPSPELINSILGYQQESPRPAA